MADNDQMRDMLLRLICAAPDPCGFSRHYLDAWNDARALLQKTCPNHYDDSGTCPNCHADMVR